MPRVRPFRALRYAEEAVGDLASVLSPPYDVIGPEEQRALLARHPRNVVRLDLPPDEPGDPPDERYRRAARTFVAWRSDGTLRKDPRPALYVYEQTYRVPGTEVERTQRGFFARLRLEPVGDAIRPHERTMSGPKEDRYRLLRATGANFSPVIGLYEDRSGRSAELVAAVAGRPATVEVQDDDGVRHRLWVVADEGDDRALVAELAARAGDGPITIADGHHRYETALRYRDERRMVRSCDEDPPFDYVLALLVDVAAGEPTVLATHRVLYGLDEAGVDRLLERLPELFELEPAERAALESEFGPQAALRGGGAGRFGLWTRRGGLRLRARRDAFEPFVRGVAGWLDVALLGTALERLCGISAEAVAAGAIRYTKSAAEAIELVERRSDGADAAFLLEPTPVRDVLAVAGAGELMPQKSTYFYPKPASGLVLNPHEW